jgi:hypothetical protein
MATAADIARRVFDGVIAGVTSRAIDKIEDAAQRELVRIAMTKLAVELRAEFQRVVIELRYHVMDAQVAMLELATERAKLDAAAAFQRGRESSEGMDIEIAPHGFQPGTSASASLGPSEETCRICGKDPRNVIHQQG